MINNKLSQEKNKKWTIWFSNLSISKEDDISDVIKKIKEYNKIITSNTDSLIKISAIEFNIELNKLVVYLEMAKVYFDKNNMKLFQQMREKFYNGYDKLSEKYNIEKEIDNSKNVMEFMKKNFYINNDELVHIFKGKYWIFLLIKNSKEFRVFNLTSHKDWFHISQTWQFCAWNTFSALQDLLLSWKIPEFLTILAEILSNYDDWKHHMATEKDFENWKNFDKHVLQEQNIDKYWYLVKNVISAIEHKYSVIKDIIEWSHFKISEKTKKYVLTKIEELKTKMIIYN